MSDAENLAQLIFDEPDRPVSPEPIPTPEWPRADGKVFARALSGDARDQHETFVSNLVERGGRGRLKPNSIGIRAHLVALGSCLADGSPIFTVADVERLGQKNAAPLDRLYDAIRRLSGMDRDEDAEKKSETTTGDGSS